MKKMRKLIPAFAMLLVSAIMMSTASFAWFTMNEEVTATGMSIQAQAGGSMVIDTQALTATTNKITVDFANRGSTKLTPITYAETKLGENDVTGWVKPAADAVIDSLTGHNTGDWQAAALDDATSDKNGNYVEYIVYVGLAGDSKAYNIQATISIPDNALEIANAYAIAFYVTDHDVAATDNDLALILHATSEGRDATNTGKLFDAAEMIPSTVGATAENPVGLRITMRVYVDGNLQRPEADNYIPQKATYKTAVDTQYSKDLTYYVLENGAYVPAAVENVYAEGDTITEDTEWYLFDKYIDDTANAQPTYYVSNQFAPEAPTGLEVSFELVDGQ